ncbi:MAG TPA: T9SS type A sorting domain-containing protein [Bacteroidales bacterium]|nr:T9SS type A sorting domain-containing protein [Bacteroidales bacterium]HOR82129.1 T9SS type A sorting domain-containing protein [Bacteroidales bacterium]HPJ90408.1 T9SS type A sorting domain-containing protein [Bacteroidales bacterium]
MKTKILSIVITIIGCSLPFQLTAQNVSYWDGVSASIWTNGTGSKGMPYLIESAEHLAYLAQSVNANTTTHYDSVYFKLTTNINLRGFPWTPIGNANTKYFAGYFDGNNHTIDSLRVNITATATSFAGLFGVLNNAHVHHLTLSNVNIAMQSVSAGVYAGGIAGMVRGNDVIQYCDVTGGSILSISSTDRKSHAGGIVGFTQITTNSIKINNCTNAAFVTSNYSVGGILGTLNTTQPYQDTLWITACSNTGSIVGAPTTTNLYTGGIVGWIAATKANTQCYVDNCSNTGNVRDSVNAGLLVYTGGIAGYIQIYDPGATNVNVIVSNSWNSGAIENINTASTVPAQNWSCAGGVIGCAGLFGTANIDCFNLHNSGTINFIRHAALVTSSVGGIAGLVFSEKAGSCIAINQVYNAGAITLLSPDTATKNTCAGGILGWINSVDGSTIINECFNIGNISNESYNSGGIMGYLYESAAGSNTISNCLNSGKLQSAEAVAGIVACIEFKGVQTHSINNCISVGMLVDNVKKAPIAVLDNTSLDLATCYYDRQITACDSGYFYAGNAIALNDTLRYSRQLAELQLDTSVWYMEDKMYPRLRCFKDADAMIVASTPIYFYAKPSEDLYNTVNEVNRPFNMGGIAGTHFHSSEPSLLTVINNDSASVTTTVEDTVVLTVAYRTASRDIEIIIKPRPVIDTIVNLVLCNNQLPYFYKGVYILGDTTYYSFVPSVHDADTNFTVNATVYPSYDTSITLSLREEDFPYIFGSQTLTGAGTYYEVFQSVNGCDSTVHLLIIPDTGELSLTISGVSVENNQNVIEWEKPNSQTIENFNIYRESDVNNLYNFLGSVPYDSAAVYVDTTANPSMKAYRYVISFTTINNYESDYSPHHQTIHLTINKGIGNTWNLIWSHYEGVAYNSYRIYRGSSSDSMLFLTEIAGHLNSYTDEVVGTAYYYIEIIPSNPSPNPVSPYLKSNKHLYTIKSNTVSNGATDIASLENEGKVLISPNPAQDYIHIQWDGNIDVNELVIYDIYGKMIKKTAVTQSERLDISDLTNGFYILQLKKDNQTIGNYKILKTK